jgi:hypothetical protein
MIGFWTLRFFPLFLTVKIILQDEKKQLLILSRGCSVFAFNFSAGKVSNLSLNIPRLKGQL